MEINKEEIEKEREIIKDLQKQVKEKDKQLKDQRHQICEKIRHKAKWRNPPSVLQFIISAKDLDQIEKGE